MNIKKGETLKHKGGGGSRKVLAIVDDCYLMSYTFNQNCGDTFYTLEGLKETFELPEEKFVPKKGMDYWSIVINRNGDCDIDEWVWSNDKADKAALSNSNCFPTKEAAEAKLAEVLAVLKK